MKIKQLIKSAINNGIIPTRLIMPFWSFIRHKKRHDLVFEVHLTDHCNLSCKFCDHFSPLAQEVFIDIDVYKKDCERLSFLTNQRVKEVRLLGGEPLLNPETGKVIEITRNYFNKTLITIITNGILLTKQSEEFWRSCRKNKAEIVVTKYPIKLDYTKIEKLARDNGVKLKYWGGEIKTSYHCVLDLEGKHNPKESFKLCYKSNVCIHLSNGKLYPCPTIPYVFHFNNYFKKNLEICEKDFVDIHKAKGIKEIKAFLSKPVPFCRYCAVEKTDFGIPWGTSKKTIDEWT